jgi:hypothetical protein
VALGDSYTSAPNVPVQSTSSPGCDRSGNNYPSDTAAALRLTLTDVSCSGATTDDMTSPQDVAPGPANPPQFSALNAGTQVVSLQVGGDNIGFKSIIENCIAMTPWGPTIVGMSCRSYYDPDGDDSLLASINALAPTLRSLVQQIHVLAPKAKIFVVGYPDILPPDGSCWPSIPFEDGDARYLDRTEVELDNMLATAATENGAVYVDTYTPSTGHNACSPESDRWVEPIIPSSPAMPVHPNASGEAGMAAVLETAMRANGVS